MALKDSLNEDNQGGVKGEAKTYTLDPQDIQFLSHLNAYLQSQLDAIQQHVAATFLNHAATTRFGYAPGKDLRFNFDPSKEKDNLTITEITEE